MGKNPYEFLRPVVINKGFVGRHHLIDEICQELSFSGGASYAIIGGRRFGKTSLFLSVQEKVNVTPEYRDLLCVFVDLNQGFASPEEFFNFVLNEIYCQAFSRFQNAHLARQFASNINSVGSYQEFVEMLQSILGKMPEKTRVGLLLDEVDTVLCCDWHEKLFGRLRTLVYSSPIKDSVSLVLGGTYFYYETKKRGSPLMNILRPIDLVCMEKSAVHELAEIGGILSEEIEKAVWDYSGGHPHLAQYILYYLWKASPHFVDVPMSMVYAAVKQYYKDYNQNLINWATATGKDGRKVYDLLARYKEWMSEEKIAREAKLSMSRTNQALVNLCFQGVVYANPETGADYRAQGDLFRDWFMQNREELLGEPKSARATDQRKPNPIYHVEHLEVVHNKLEAGVIYGNVSQETGLTASEVNKLFKAIYRQIKTRPETTTEDKKEIAEKVQEIEKSLSSKKMIQNS